MKIAFFDAKPYDIPGFDHYAAHTIVTQLILQLSFDIIISK